MPAVTSVKGNGKPRIAYLIPYLRGFRGWVTFVEGAIRSLQNFVEPVLIVSQGDRAAVREKFPRLEHHVLPTVQAEEWSGTAGSMLRRMVPALWRTARIPPLRVKLVHSLEMFPAGWAGDVLARTQRAPHALTAFGTYAVIWNTWPLLDRFYRGVLRRAAAVYPISHGTEAKLWEAYPEDLAGTVVRTVLCGSRAAEQVPAGLARDRRPPPAPVVLSVGMVKPRKGYHISLSAFGRLQKRFPQAAYHIVGRPDPAYRAHLDGIVRREKLHGVRFHGTVDPAELDRLYRSASVFLLLSQEVDRHFEGFGLVFLEAGAYGLPSVGSRSGGIPDVVIDGDTGFVVDPTDAEEAGRALIRLAENPSLSARMGMAGRERAEHLSWDRYAAEQWDQYRRLLGV
ncbi:MAG: glycosyltransferase family 4 protein [Anaerolineales bacterium]|nr:glycosyltransferase family 4 protein [Anaerolineales bacterium]